jgi:hypothetical protein
MGQGPCALLRIVVVPYLLKCDWVSNKKKRFKSYVMRLTVVSFAMEIC